MDSFGFTQHTDSCLFVPAKLVKEILATAGQSETHKAVAAPPPENAFLSTSDLFPPELLEPLDCDPGPLITLFSAKALTAAHERIRTQGPRNKADRELMQSLLRRIFTFGTLRRCGLPHNWDAQMEQLKQDHVNFSEVVDFIQREFSLAEASNQPPRLPAMLLDGPPGCGRLTLPRRFPGSWAPASCVSTSKPGSPLLS